MSRVGARDDRPPTGAADGTTELAEVHESPTTVEVRVTGGGGVPGGDACADSVEVVLDEALGDRQVIDLSTGAVVEREG